MPAVTGITGSLIPARVLPLMNPSFMLTTLARSASKNSGRVIAVVLRSIFFKISSHSPVSFAESMVGARVANSRHKSRPFSVERSFDFSRTTNPRSKIFSMMFARVAAVPMPLSFITATIASRCSSGVSSSKVSPAYFIASSKVASVKCSGGFVVSSFNVTAAKICFAAIGGSATVAFASRFTQRLNPGKSLCSRVALNTAGAYGPTPPSCV